MKLFNYFPNYFHAQFLSYYLSITSRFKTSARALRMASFFASCSLLSEANGSTCSPEVTRCAALAVVGRAFGCCSVYFVKLFSLSRFFNARSLSRCCFKYSVRFFISSGEISFACQSTTREARIKY